MFISRDFFISRLAPLFLLGLLVWGGVIAGKEINRYMQLSKKAADLRAQAEELSRANTELANDAVNEDPVIVEKEARRRLNLQKPNEAVVIIIPGDEERIINNVLRAREKTVTIADKNEWSWGIDAQLTSLKKWIEFLFGREE